MAMHKVLLSSLFLFLIIFPSYAFADGPYLNIPPTNAFDKIHSDNGTINAVNFSMPLNIIGGSGVSVTSQNGTHTVTITNTAAVNTHTGTYNQTLANNVVKNSGGKGLNFINGTNNPISLVNDPTRNQINITISSTGAGGGGVTSLNALVGALTIAGVAGNTTVSTGVSTITINTAYNIVTTGGSAQVITKGLTLNALTLGGNAAGGNKNFTGLNNVNATKFYQNGTQVIDTLTQGSGISISGSGHSRTITNTGILNAITSVNSQTGPSINIVCQTGNTTCTNSTNQIKIGFGVNPVITGGAAQTISKQITHSATLVMSGADINLGTNQLTGNWTAKDSPIFGTGGNTYAYIQSNNFNGYPNSAHVGAIGWNFQAPAIDFWNTFTTADTSFAFRQLTGTNTQSTLFTIDKTSITSYVKNIWLPIADPTNHFTNSIWKSSTNTDVLKYRNNGNTTTYNILSTLGAVTTSTPANPSGTTSTTAVMMGLAGSIKPAVSTRIDVTICGQMANSVINDGATIQLRYGTGTAPTNAAALTGTQLGASQTVTEKVAAQNDGYCVTGIATGLTIGTTYWLDVALNAVTGGTATTTGITIKASEI